MYLVTSFSFAAEWIVSRNTYTGWWVYFKSCGNRTYFLYITFACHVKEIR